MRRRRSFARNAGAPDIDTIAARTAPAALASVISAAAAAASRAIAAAFAAASFSGLFECLEIVVASAFRPAVPLRRHDPMVWRAPWPQR